MQNMEYIDLDAKDFETGSSFHDDFATASEGDSDGPAVRHAREAVMDHLAVARPPLPGERLEWSSDGNPDQAYLAFKNRKSLKRKRAAAEGAKARVARRTDAAKAKAATSGTGVGKRIVAAPKNDSKQKKKKKKKQWGDAESDYDDELLDEVLPDYIQDRKTHFEKARNHLGDSGLKLPPTYEDIYFSEDEQKNRLLERPHLVGSKTSAPYKDILLAYSGGIIPAPIAQWLRDYQVKGAEFLHEAFVYQRGAILGDDMGLGKTIQVIAFLTAAFGKTGDQRDGKRMRKMRRASDGRWYPRVLLVCPGSLMENWKSELERWGWWQVYVYHGSTAEKEAALQAARSGHLEIMITTYTTYRAYMSAINTVDWDCVIADECHIIKSRSSEITNALNNVNALCRIGLTGTAIQNNYNELWTLLNWVNPGVVGSLSAWRNAISDPLRIGQAHDATVSELATARRTANNLVQNLLPRFFLRRMKSLIAHQLPKKSDRVVFCPLTDTQADAYENIVNGEIVQCIQRSTEMCDCSSGKRRGWCCFTTVRDDEKWQIHVFPMIVVLQKLANHLALLLPLGTDSTEKQDKDREQLEIAVPDLWQRLMRNMDNITNYANPDFCGKWKVLKRLLQFWYNNGDKVLVFSHSTRLLRMLQILFSSTTTYNVSYLDGQMKYEERQRTVDDFNSNPSQFVFLISTKAGGVGLNITSANKVVVVDPNWNPSFDLQAQDRAYRIGQTRDVEVFRLVSAGTIEEIVYARQIYKQQQANIGYNASLERRYFRGVQDLKEKKGEIFGLANLFAYQHDNVVLREIVNKTNVAESKVGVLVAGIDMSQVDKEEDGSLFNPVSPEDSQEKAMNHLAKLVENGGDPVKSGKQAAKKTDAIQAILASAGVDYTHENSEVIGTSKVESRISKRAMEKGGEGADTLNKEPIFASESDQAMLRVPTRKGPSDEDEHGDEADLEVVFKYHPPEDIRRRQFCTMAKTFGFSDATEFALVVESWTQEQRRNCLDKFYAERRKLLLVEAKTAGPLTPIREDPAQSKGALPGTTMEEIGNSEETEDDGEL